VNRLAALSKLWTKKPPPVGTTPHDVVFAENKWRLLRYRSDARTAKTPVLLVPSLINRHYVLDLLPGKSFAEYLVQQGFDVFVIDWGTPTDEDRFVTFEDIVVRYLGRAIRVATRVSGAPKVNVLGYCLGGTLAVIHAALEPERIASLVTLATPIRFRDGGLLSTWTQTKSFDLRALVDGMGNVPWQLMQSAFHLLRPTMSLSKAVQLVDRAWDDEFLDGFLAIETWGNDNVSFPGACYVDYIERLYRNDELIRGELRLDGRQVDLEAITCPLLNVTFQHDAIVPSESASVLTQFCGSTDKETLALAGGHVGAVVSKKAAFGLWPAISAFWKARDVSVKRSSRPARRASPKRAVR
jgi:polyhydroxyalkanoate synthase subunit PhaC